MPYFGKTKWGIADDYGPSSIAVYNVSEKGKSGLQFPICVALDFGGMFAFTHNGRLYEIQGGRIALVQKVESLLLSKPFSLTEDEIYDALVTAAMMDLVIDGTLKPHGDESLITEMQQC